jgi:O-antigen/teichoic acid export membrane protein
MFGGYGLAVTADGVARLLIAVPLVFVASSGTAAAAVAAAGIAGALVPVGHARRRFRALLARGTGHAFHFHAAVAFAGPAAVIAGADQILVNGGPLLVVLQGGPDATETAGVVFAATMLVRIPVYLFQGPAASLLPNLTTLHAQDDGGLFRRTIRRAAAALLGMSLVLVVLAATIGPWAMSLLFGSGFEATSAELTLLAVGVSFYLAAATMSQALLAAGDVGRPAAGWAASAVAFVVLYAVFGGDQLSRVAEAFAIATALAALLVGAALARRLRVA